MKEKLDYIFMKHKLYILLFCIAATTNSLAQNPTSHVVNAGMYYYAPANLTINVGDTVTWINDAGFHDVNGDINSLTGVSYNNPVSFYLPPTSGPSTIGSYVFTVAGSYSYDCSIGSHAANGMVGTIIVNCNVSLTQTTAGFNPNPLSTAGTWSYDILNIANTSNCDIRVRPEFTIERNNGVISAGDITLKAKNIQLGVWANIPYTINANGDAVGSLGMPLGDTTGIILAQGSSFQDSIKVKFNGGGLWGDYCATWATQEVDVSGNIIQNLSSATTCLTLDNCSNLAANLQIINHVTCNGFSDGQATANASGGTGPYTYVWVEMNTGITVNPNSLPAGSYACAVTDFNGCLFDSIITITEPDYFSVDFTTSANNICEGDIVTLNFDFNQGGIAPYTINYTENGVPQTLLANNIGLNNIPVSPLVGVNTYNIISITDANGCINQNAISGATIQVLELPDANISTTSSTNCDGTASVTVSGGCPPYSYFWDNSSTVDSISNLCAGTYCIIVSDCNGCSTNECDTVHPTAAINGCTDSTACNYDALANTDDGTCIYAPTSNTNYTVCDSFTWNDSTYTTSGTYYHTISDTSLSYSGTVSLLTYCPSNPNLNFISSPQAIIEEVQLSGDNFSLSNNTAGTNDSYEDYTNNSGLNGEYADLTEGNTYTVNITLDNLSTASYDPEAVNVYIDFNIDGDFDDVGEDLGAINIPTGTFVPGTVYPFNLTVPTTGVYGPTRIRAVCMGNGGTGVVMGPCESPTSGWDPPYFGATEDYSIVLNDPSAATVSLLTYCPSNPNPNFTSSPQAIIEEVQLTGDNFSLSNNTSGTNDSYEDYTNNSGLNGEYADLTEGNTYTVNITLDNLSTASYDPEAVNVYIDFNIDGDFDDVGEDLGIINIPTGTFVPGTVYPFNLTVPATGIYGPTRIRAVCMGNSGSGITMGPCEAPTGFDTPWFGGTEDYSIVLNNPSASCDSVATLYLTVYNSTSDTVSITNCNDYTDYTGYIHYQDSLFTYTMSSLITGCDSTIILDLTINTCTIPGCTDILADNYDPTATLDDGSCIYCQLTANTTTLNPSCFGYSDGAVTITPNGGVSPYSIEWGGAITVVANVLTVPALSAGTYSYSITDGNGCIATDLVTISGPSLIIPNLTINDVTCNGYNDGSASINTITGGTAPYTYLWSDSTTSSTIQGLNADTPWIAIVDMNNCVIIDTFIVSEPAVLTANSSSTDILCHGYATGYISANTSGGTTPYSYLWDDSLAQTTQTATSLIAGIYSCTITDANGCQFITSPDTITQPLSELTTSTSASPVTCYGDSDGSITININGGTSDYFINALGYGIPLIGNNVLSSDSLPMGFPTVPIPAGIYPYTITDNNNCVFNDTIIITEPDSLSIILTAEAICCFGNNNGTAIVNVIGGTPGYTYYWSNSQTTPFIDNLSAGNYSCLITDANGCVVEDSIIVNQNPIMSSSITATNPLCFGDSTGSITINTIGGDGNYTYIWSNGDTTANLNNLPAGTYTCTVEDGCGCIETLMVSLSEPNAISLTDSINNITSYGLNDGSIYISTLGGTGSLITSWTSNNSFSSSNEDIDNLLAGTYYLEITDNNACAYLDTITLTQPNSLTISDSNTHVSCYDSCDGNINITVNGGIQPYSYSWTATNGGYLGANSSTNEDLSNLCPGTYTVIIDDNVTTLTQAFNIYQPQEITYNLTSDSILCHNGLSESEILVWGGTQPYTYNWSNFDSTYSTMLSSGSHSVHLTDQNGCSIYTTFTLNQPDSISNYAIVTQPISCFGGNDGSAIVNASGGTPGYTYLWNDPLAQNTISATNLSSGTYLCVITDSSGCIDSAYVTLSDGNSMSITINTTHTTCYGYMDGTANANAILGAAPYTYLWNDPLAQNTQTADSLIAGNYSCVITDANGCSEIASAIVDDADPILVNIWIEGDSLVATSSFLSYQWYSVSSGVGIPIPGATSEIFNPSSMGEYYVAVTDNEGCSETSYTIYYNVNGLNNLDQIIKIYPNPTDGLITIDGIRAIKNITFLDIIGNQLLKVEKNSKQSSSTRLDLSSFAKGTYFIQIEQNNQIMNYRIVLQ